MDYVICMKRGSIGHRRTENTACTTHEADRDIPGRARSGILLSLAIANLLIACGGGGAEATSAGDTTPPAAPTVLAAATDGPFGANLSWQPSTDNDVTGFKVERCRGAGCSSFAQVAAPAGASYTDVGLDPATSYSYRVRATDASANLSAFSNVASATTAIAPPLPLAVLPDWVNN